MSAWCWTSWKMMVKSCTVITNQTSPIPFIRISAGAKEILVVRLPLEEPSTNHHSNPIPIFGLFANLRLFPVTAARSTPCAFVTYGSFTEAEQCIQNLNDQEHPLAAEGPLVRGPAAGPPWDIHWFGGVPRGTTPVSDCIGWSECLRLWWSLIFSVKIEAFQSRGSPLEGWRAWIEWLGASLWTHVTPKAWSGFTHGDGQLAFVTKLQERTRLFFSQS